MRVLNSAWPCGLLASVKLVWKSEEMRLTMSRAEKYPKRIVLMSGVGGLERAS